MDFEKSSIEKLKRALYSRDENIVPKEKRTTLQGDEQNVAENWGEKHSFDIYSTPMSMTKESNTFFNKFLKISLWFFVACLLVAGYVFWGGSYSISSNNVDIEILAPSSVSSGEELDLGLSVLNKNKTDLEEASLYIDYPLGSQAVNTTDRILSHEKIDLGTILHGTTKDYSARTLLFGPKDTVKTFTFRLEYKVKGSNAVFSKEKTLDVSIGSSPILLNATAPKELTSGDTVTLSIDITSNSAVPIKNTLVKVDYPYGFTYKSSNQSPFSGNTLWSIGDLKNGDKKTLTISGTMVGQNLEDRSFRVSAGTGVLSTSKNFDTELALSIVTVGIRKSFFDLSVTTENNGVGSIGETMPITIGWENTLPDRIINANITAVVDGNVFDNSAVFPNNGGFYRSLNNTITWDKNSTDNLSEIFPGVNGQVGFSLTSISNPIKIQSIKNPHINVHVVIKGDKVGTDPAPVSSSADLVVRFPSTLTLSAKTYRETGPFQNTGPIPPRVDKESTYTVTWSLTNTTNDLKNAFVSAILDRKSVV